MHRDQAWLEENAHVDTPYYRSRDFNREDLTSTVLERMTRCTIVFDLTVCTNRS